jgi:hypothetical protein
MALFENTRTEPMSADPTEHEKGIVQCLKDIRMVVVAAGSFWMRTQAKNTAIALMCC